MNEQEVRRAIKIVHEYGVIKSMAGGDDQELIDAFQTLIDFALKSLEPKVEEIEEILYSSGCKHCGEEIVKRLAAAIVEYLRGMK